MKRSIIFILSIIRLWCAILIIPLYTIALFIFCFSIVLFVDGAEHAIDCFIDRWKENFDELDIFNGIIK